MVERGLSLCSHYPAKDHSPHVSGTYPANDRLDHPRNVVLLQTKQVRGLTVHSEAVGIIVVLHGADKASVPGHHIGQLRMRTDRLGKQVPAILPGQHVPGSAKSLTVPSTLSASYALNQRFIFHHMCILPVSGKKNGKEADGPLRLQCTCSNNQALNKSRKDLREFGQRTTRSFTHLEEQRSIFLRIP